MDRFKNRLKFKLGTKINIIVLTIILFLSVVIGSVVVKEVNDGIKTFAVHKAKGDLHLAYRYINESYSGDWKIKNGNLYKGYTLINENYELLDNIGDTRITTNVIRDGERVIGTQASPEVT